MTRTINEEHKNNSGANGYRTLNGLWENKWRIILSFEWVLIAFMIVTFWMRSPPFRDQWLFLLGFMIPIYLARWMAYRRLWTRTPLDPLLVGFVLLTLYNFHNAPLARQSYLVLVCRPLLGIIIIQHFVEHVRHHGQMRYLQLMTILLAIGLGCLALVSTQWQTADKSELFTPIISILPILDFRQFLPDMQLSFNANEVAGALVYVCIFSLGTSLSSFVEGRADLSNRKDRVLHWMMRWGAMSGFLLTFSALLLGQSRFALAGLFVAGYMVIGFILPRWRWRVIGLIIWTGLLVVEMMIVTNFLPINFPAGDASPSVESSGGDVATLNSRDERTLSTRFELWERALWMMRDYPLTGAGMSTYRALVMREDYMIPYYEGQQFGPPHAHNMVLQVGADLGIPGMLIYIGWYLVLFWMAIQVWRQSPISDKNMTICITGSILAGMGYGVGDAITLWDRFAFIHWWFMGLTVALYIYSRANLSKPERLQIQT